jgi:hypothetical protein
MNGIATATQTISCTPDLQPIILNSATFVPTYSADLQATRRLISIRHIEGPFGAFADSDANFQFFDDGRLKSINQNTTGQGETIVNSFVTLATTFSGFHLLKATAAPPASLCDTVKKWGGGDPGPGKPPPSVSLTYTAELNSSIANPFNPKQSVQFQVAEASQALWGALTGNGTNNWLPSFTLSTAKTIGSRSVDFSAPSSGLGGQYVNLLLQRVDTADLSIVVDKQSGAPGGVRAVWKGTIPIPTTDTYDLPIPMAALFGTQKFGLTVSDAGVVTQIDYAKNTGLAGAANAANSIAGALAPESTANKAADIKAQADVIAQQQRLHRCLVNPTTCT